ncbi:MAG: hypothetical protein JEZ03_14340, partial [Bacteroidales bacterium]|nr:hypothetical protein [Bacteroidales bacterium]
MKHAKDFQPDSYRDWKVLLILFIISLIISLIPLLIQKSPGYMDGDYYYAIGLQLFEGKGFTEDFIWNFLDNPLEIPHPSNTYWMPLASIISFFGMKLFSSDSFIAARAVFLILASSIPPLTYILAQKITGKKRTSLFAAVLSLIPGYYFVYQVNTDTFTLYMLLGGLFLLLGFGNNPFLERKKKKS